MIIFGLLDLSIVATYAARVPREVRHLPAQPLLNGMLLLVTASLAISGYGLLRGRAWALILNYIQFPFRIAFALLSFAWLAEILAPNGANAAFHLAVWYSAIALEALRLGVTITLHQRVKREARAANGLCPECGYDLRESPERCPECGVAVHRQAAHAA